MFPFERKQWLCKIRLRTTFIPEAVTLEQVAKREKDVFALSPG